MGQRWNTHMYHLWNSLSTQQHPSTLSSSCFIAFTIIINHQNLFTSIRLTRPNKSTRYQPSLIFLSRGRVLSQPGFSKPGVLSCMWEFQQHHVVSCNWCVSFQFCKFHFYQREPFKCLYIYLIEANQQTQKQHRMYLKHRSFLVQNRILHYTCMFLRLRMKWTAKRLIILLLSS